MTVGQFVFYGSKQDQVYDVSGRLTIGRTPDNSCRIEDSVLSRRHAVIERRGDAFYVRDLGSSNGTELNGRPLHHEAELCDGDQITLGGRFRAQFRLVAGEQPKPVPIMAGPVSVERENTSAFGETFRVGTEPKMVAPSWGTTLMAVILGISLTSFLLFGVKSLFDWSSNRNVTVEILNPLSGATIRGKTQLQVDVRGARNIKRVLYEIDGEPVAVGSVFPFSTWFDPSSEELAAVVPPRETVLVTARLEFSDRTQPVRSRGVLVRLDVSRKLRPAETTFRPQSGATASIAINLQTLLAQVTGRSGFIIAPEISRNLEAALTQNQPVRCQAEEIQLLTKAFRDQGVPPMLGIMLVKSRIFRSEAGQMAAVGSGLLEEWGIPPAVAAAYLGRNETPETLRDPKRCAEVAALYIRDIAVAFDPEDVLSVVASYGKPVPDASRLRSQLERLDPGKILRGDVGGLLKAGLFQAGDYQAVERFFLTGLWLEYGRDFGGEVQPLSARL